MTYIGQLLGPIATVLAIFRNHVSRRNEYEADRNAVKEGFGEELIATFTRLSTDELVDIHPARIIEILDYDHPGMINRILAEYVSLLIQKQASLKTVLKSNHGLKAVLFIYRTPLV